MAKTHKTRMYTEEFYERPQNKYLQNISEYPTTPEMRKEWASKGGIASAKKKRERKEMKETLKWLLDTNIKDGKPEEITSILSGEGKNVSAQQAMLLAQVKKAVTGDLRALEFIRDTIGERPVEKQEVEQKVSTSGKIDQLIEALGVADEIDENGNTETETEPVETPKAKAVKSTKATTKK